MRDSRFLHFRATPLGASGSWLDMAPAYVALDIESTGMNPRKDRIVSLAIAFPNAQMVCTTCQMMAPSQDRPVPPRHSIFGPTINPPRRNEGYTRSMSRPRPARPFIHSQFALREPRIAFDKSA